MRRQMKAFVWNAQIFYIIVFCLILPIQNLKDIFLWSMTVGWRLFSGHALLRVDIKTHGPKIYFFLIWYRSLHLWYHVKQPLYFSGWDHNCTCKYKASQLVLFTLCSICKLSSRVVNYDILQLVVPNQWIRFQVNSNHDS